MNTNTKKNTKATKQNNDEKLQGKRNINNNTAFYINLKMKYDMKCRKI